MLSYPKVNAAHKIGQESILSGPVVLEEKTDGSQIRIKITPDSIEFGSRRVEFNNRGIDSNFTKAVETFTKNYEQIAINFSEMKSINLFGEYFSKEKQNTIKYNRIPKNHIMLFDVALENIDGSITWCDNEIINNWANTFQIEGVPFLGEGKFILNEIKEISEQESILRGSKREGVVIKARDRRYNTNLLSLQEHPFMCAKYVRPEFQEQNKAEHPGRGDKIKQLIDSYCNKPRWQKAVFRLRDEGNLEGTMKDLKYIIPEIKDDIINEDKDEIKERLWEIFNKEIIQHSVRGCPEWYQEYLLDENA